MTQLGGGSFFSVTVHAAAPGAHYLLDISVSGAPASVSPGFGGGMSATPTAPGMYCLFYPLARSPKRVSRSLWRVKACTTSTMWS